MLKSLRTCKKELKQIQNINLVKQKNNLLTNELLFLFSHQQI